MATLVLPIFPAAHNLHDDCEGSSWNLPLEHSVQLLLFRAWLIWPTAQSSHSRSDVAVGIFLTYVPAEHSKCFLQKEAPLSFGWYCPAAHAVHDGEFWAAGLG